MAGETDWRQNAVTGEWEAAEPGSGWSHSDRRLAAWLSGDGWLADKGWRIYGRGRRLLGGGPGRSADPDTPVAGYRGAPAAAEPPGYDLDPDPDLRPGPHAALGTGRYPGTGRPDLVFDPDLDADPDLDFDPDRGPDLEFDPDLAFDPDLEFGPDLYPEAGAVPGGRAMPGPEPARPARASRGGTASGGTKASRKRLNVLTVIAMATAFCVMFAVSAMVTSHVVHRPGSRPAAAVPAPIAHLKALASRYQTIVTMANQQLVPEMMSFTASRNVNLPAARMALMGEVTVSRSFDASLTSWLADWKQAYAAAAAARRQAPSPVIIPYPASVTATVQELIQADQARESVLGREEASVSLEELQSFSAQDRSAAAAVTAKVTVLGMALQLSDQ